MKIPKQAMMLAFAAAVVGCASTNVQPPPLLASNPASAEARESVTPTAKPMLRRDALTKKTNELLAANMPGTPSFQPSEMHQRMGGDMEGMQHDPSGAMKMEPGENKPVNATSYYTCPMHPQVHEDKPGKCPICGTTLIKKEGGSK